MKKTVVFLAVVIAMFMMPMVSSAVGIDGTISMDTELIEFDDEWHDTDEWFTGDGEPYEGDIPMYMEPITQDGGNSILDIGNMDEEKDVDITIPKYDGMVNTVTNFGMFIELPNLVEGLVRLDDMTDDYYVYDEETFSLRGTHNKRGYRLGDIVRVRVKAANKEAKTIDFEIVTGDDNGDK